MLVYPAGLRNCFIDILKYLMNAEILFVSLIKTNSQLTGLPVGGTGSRTMTFISGKPFTSIRTHDYFASLSSSNIQI
jgi:hypothetical protein